MELAYQLMKLGWVGMQSPLVHDYAKKRAKKKSRRRKKRRDKKSRRRKKKLRKFSRRQKTKLKKGADILGLQNGADKGKGERERKPLVPEPETAWWRTEKAQAWERGDGWETLSAERGGGRAYRDEGGFLEEARTVPMRSAAGPTMQPSWMLASAGGRRDGGLGRGVSGAAWDVRMSHGAVPGHGRGRVGEMGGVGGRVGKRGTAGRAAWETKESVVETVRRDRAGAVEEFRGMQKDRTVRARCVRDEAWRPVEERAARRRRIRLDAGLEEGMDLDALEAPEAGRIGVGAGGGWGMLGRGDGGVPQREWKKGKDVWQKGYVERKKDYGGRAVEGAGGWGWKEPMPAPEPAGYMNPIEEKVLRSGLVEERGSLGMSREMGRMGEDTAMTGMTGMTTGRRVDFKEQSESPGGLAGVARKLDLEKGGELLKDAGAFIWEHAESEINEKAFKALKMGALKVKDMRR